MIEFDLLNGLHLERLVDLVKRVISAAKDIDAGGYFNGVAECENLWDEACWAMQRTKDGDVREALRLEMAKVAWAVVGELLPAELCIHAYFLSDDHDENWKPFPEKEPLVEETMLSVTERAILRDIRHLDPL